MDPWSRAELHAGFGLRRRKRGFVRGELDESASHIDAMNAEFGERRADISRGHMDPFVRDAHSELAHRLAQLRSFRREVRVDPVRHAECARRGISKDAPARRRSPGGNSACRVHLSREPNASRQCQRAKGESLPPTVLRQPKRNVRRKKSNNNEESGAVMKAPLAKGDACRAMIWGGVDNGRPSSLAEQRPLYVVNWLRAVGD